MFNEQKQEYSRAFNKKVPVVQLPKYKESKKLAEKVISNYKDITEGDFWILINESKKKEEVYYSGLIISHNGCLKLNDTLEKKFDPESVSVDKDGFKNSLVFTYCNKEQGIYEVGEVSAENCKNAYPYAMAYKRCFDRVVLKLSKLAYAGVYSDSEAEEFQEPEPVVEEKPKKEPKKPKEEPKEDDVLLPVNDREKKVFIERCKALGQEPTDILKKVGWTEGLMTVEQHGKALIILKEIEESNE